jgi:diketogulonate reductase-like aldo/keto reductase
LFNSLAVAAARHRTANGLAYQGFSLLTASRQVMVNPKVQRIAKRHGRTVEQVIFRFASKSASCR